MDLLNRYVIIVRYLRDTKNYKIQYSLPDCYKKFQKSVTVREYFKYIKYI